MIQKLPYTLNQLITKVIVVLVFFVVSFAKSSNIVEVFEINNPTAKVQLIHNSPDPSLASVDIYLNSVKVLSDVNFRSSSPFLDVPADELIEIAVAPANSTSVSQAFFTADFDFVEDEKYILIASGVNSTSGFNTSVNSPIDFDLKVFEGAREQSLAVAGITDLLFFHGAPDIGNININETSIPVGTILSNLAYDTFSTYLQIATNNYSIEVVENSTSNSLNTYDIPLLELGLQNKAITVLTSGFLDPFQNNNGDAYGVWISLPEGGNLIELPFEGNCITFQSPFNENFSGSNWAPGTGFFNTNDTFFDCWQRNPTNNQGQYAWVVASSAGGFNTGPSAPFEGDNFMYTVAFLGNPNDQATLKTPIVNLGNLDAPALSFHYHMFGTQINSLQVEIREFGEEVWTNIATINGQQQSSGTDDWLEQEVDLALYANKNIEVQFKAIRGVGASGNIAIDAVKFQELTDCIAPSGLSFSSITDVSVQLNWSSQPNSVNWFVLEEGGSISSSTPIAQGNTENNSVLVEGLQANTTYDVYIQSVCDSTTSNFTTQSFTTQPCAPSEQCTYTFNLTDSFGDGWNGNVIHLIQDGVLIQVIGENFGFGNSFTETVDLCTDVDIEVFWPIQGSFAAEVGFTIVDPFGEDIFTLPPNSQSQQNTVLFEFTVSCEPASCPKVSNFELVNQTDETASFSWANLAEATEGYSLLIFPAGANPSMSSPIFSENLALNTSQFTIEGLSPNTAYDAYIQALCEGEESDLSDVVSFTTNCSVFTAPYTENFSGSTWVTGTGFNNVGNAIDQCWSRDPQPGGGHFWGVATGNALPATSGPDQALVGANYIYSIGAAGTNGSLGTITSPAVDLSNLDRPGVILNYYMFGSAIGQLRVEVKTLAQTSWTQLLVVSGQQQTSADQSWIEANIDLEDFENEIIQVRLVSQRGTNFNSSIAIDGFEVNNLPECLRPINLSVSNIGSESAELSWEEADSESQTYNWFAFNEGDNPSTDTPVAEGTTSETTVVISGLVQGNSYEVYVNAVCTNEQTSNLSIPVNFSTANCEAEDRCVHVFRLLDSFGDGWNGNTMSVFENGQLVTVLGTGFTTGNLQVVEVELCDASEVELFWNAGGSFANEVGIEIINVFDEVIYEKPFNSGSQNSSLFTFDVDCQAPDGCFPPENFAVGEKTPTSVELTWDETLTAISGFNWFVFNENDNISNTPPVANGNAPSGATSIVVEGLSDNTTYKAFIRSDCGITAVSAISQPLFFQTPCSPFVAPLLENFEGSQWEIPTVGFVGQNIADCWERNPQETSQYTWSANTGFTDAVAGNKYIEVRNQQGAVGDIAFLNLPQVNLSSLEAPSLSFFSFTLGQDFGSFAVEIKNSLDEDWQEVLFLTTSEQTSPSSSWSRKIIDLEDYQNQLVDVRLRAVRGTTFFGRILIDDLRIDELPNCLPPENLFISEITDIDALLNFSTEELAINGYEWQIFEANTNPSSSTPLFSGNTVENTGVLLDNLSPDTTYDVYVRSICDSEESELSLKTSFTTEETCIEVSVVDVTNLTDTEVTLTWELSPNAVSSYQFFVMNQGEIPLVDMHVSSGFVGVSTNTVTVSNLEPSTSYDFYIKSFCSVLESEVQNATPFTTLEPCQTPIELTISEITSSTAFADWELVPNVTEGYTWFVMNEGEVPFFNTPVASSFVDEDTNFALLTNLLPNTTYDFYVQSFCFFGESEIQNFERFTTLEECLAPDSIEVTAITETTAQVSWLSVSNASEYNWFLYNEGDDVATSTPIQSGETNDNLILLGDLLPNTSYFVVVQSDCLLNESDLSDQVLFSTLEECFAPENIIISQLNSITAEVSWDEVSNASGGYNWFLFNEGDSVGVDSPLQSGDTTSNSISLSNLAPETSYFVIIQSDCSVNESDFSGEIPFTTLEECLAPQSIQVTEITETTAEVFWDEVTNASGGYNWFLFNEGDDVSVDSPTQFGNTLETDIILSDLSPNTSYFVVIQSDCSVNESDFSNPVSFTTLEECFVPENIEVSEVTETTALVSWDEVSNANQGYNWFLFLEGDDAIVDTPIEFGVTNDTFILLEDLIQTTTYFVVVQSDCTINQSAFSDSILFTTDTAPSAPPENNLACDAASLTYQVTLEATTLNATFAIDEIQGSCIEGGLNPTVWFSFENEFSGSTIDISSEENIQAITIYEAESCDDFATYTEVICSTSNLVDLGSLNLGSSYLVQVSFEEEAEFDITLDFSLSNEDFENKHLLLYPSPAKDIIWIESSFTINEYVIVNMLGQQVIKGKNNFGNRLQINVSDLIPGKYFVKAKRDKGFQVLSFIKE